MHVTISARRLTVGTRLSPNADTIEELQHIDGGWMRISTRAASFVLHPDSYVGVVVHSDADVQQLLDARDTQLQELRRKLTALADELSMDAAETRATTQGDPRLDDTRHAAAAAAAAEAEQIADRIRELLA